VIEIEPGAAFIASVALDIGELARSQFCAAAHTAFLGLDD